MVEEKVRVNGRVHDARCENANPKSQCRCRCHGMYHAKKIEDEQNKMEYITTNIDISMGGEIEKEFGDLMGKQYECPCGEINTIESLEGYVHPGGLKDKDNYAWWIYQACQKCGHQMSWWKFKGRVARLARVESFAKTPYEAVPPPPPEIENK